MRVIPLVALLGCGDKPTESVQDTSPCADAPTVTWETWGEGFVTESCQSCHASTSPDRNGAPEDVIFDTEQDVLDRATAVLSVATGESPTMPPEGGVSDDDRALLEIWLTCWGG